MTAEAWADIPGYEGLYQASTFGNVRSMFRYKKTLKPHKRGNYFDVELWKNGRRKRIGVHRLVAMAFLENPDGLPMVNHKDENPANNAVYNLEWCDHSYNTNYGSAIKRRVENTDYNTPERAEHMRKIGLSLSKPVCQIKDGRIIARFESCAHASRVTGINVARICDVANHKPMRNTAGGYHWEYEKGE